MTLITRRRVIDTALAGAASLAISPFELRTAEAKVSAAPITSTPLGNSLYLYSGAGGNVVAASGPDGALMVDGGLAERTRELLRRVTSDTGRRRVDILFNTHWHWDHTGSNERLARQGAKIVAHENTKEWLGAEIISKWENRTYEPRPAIARPTQTFYYGTQHLSFAGESLEYGIMPEAHTDGDIYVFFPRENVLVGGGVVAGGRYPIIDYCTDGWLGGMTEGLQMLIGKCDGQTRIVPESGPVRSRADLAAQLDMCSTVLDRIFSSYY
ncbi:MAG: MBL fold metallo-hydrolase, partial [Steroidobacteraceae bacterium]